MNTNEFNKPVTAAKLNENMFKKFGSKIDLNRYTREELENYRNVLRTKISQREGTANFNELLTNEAHQRERFMLDVINTRIREMLGESIQIMEKKLSAAEKRKKEQIVKSMKKDKSGFKKRYGEKGEEVMHATATKMAKKTAEAMDPVGHEDADINNDGKVDSSDRYLKKRRGAIAKKMSGEKSVKEVAIPADAEKPAINRIRSVKQATTATKSAPVKRAADLDATKIPAVRRKDQKTMEETGDKPSAGMTVKQRSAVAKKAHSGKDIGQKGKGFKEVEKAAKKGGARDPKAVAASAMWKQQSKKLKESVEQLLAESEEEKAQIISSGIDMVQDFTSWMQRIGSYQTKTMLEMGDDIRRQYGAAKSQEFKSIVQPALSDAMSVLTTVREQLNNSIAILAGEAPAPEQMIGEPEPDQDQDMSMAEPDSMNMDDQDDFAASDAAVGGPEVTGRARRESIEHTRAKTLHEAHSILSKLAR
jgi:hypothetical protein